MKEIDKLVSIIMPAYNCEKYINQAVGSVMAQTYSNWELIIVDDCSSDNTYSIAEALQQKNSRIRLLRSPTNIGVGKARNFGVDQSQGDWIAFLDSDDMWASEKLEKQLKFIEAHPVAKLVFTASAFMDDQGAKNDYILRVPEKITKQQLLKQNVISCSSVLVIKQYMQQFPFSGNPLVHEDFVTWLRILGCEKYAYGIDEPLLIYRVSANSKSGNKLQAARMQWNAYCEVNVGLISRVYYMFWYAIKGLTKYNKLARGA